MKGDISRSTFDPQKQYRSVRMQQGRVQLDADWNEQIDIILHLLETQFKDLAGVSGGHPDAFAIHPVPQQSDPPDDDGPASESVAREFSINAGRYYVDGLLCENKTPIKFSEQPDFPAQMAQSILTELDSDQQYLIYLDVWERHISAFEDPEIREPALGGPDTTTRQKTVWQVQLVQIDGDITATMDALVKHTISRGKLRVEHIDAENILENQLLRVEIHTTDANQITYKWARDNASTLYPITTMTIPEGTQAQQFMLTTKNLSQPLHPGDWVELVDDSCILTNKSGPLCLVDDVEPGKLEVVLNCEIKRENGQIILLGSAGQTISFPDDGNTPLQLEASQHTHLRKWAGKAAIGVNAAHKLTAGVQIQFEPDPNITGTDAFRSGDYWLITTRTEQDRRGMILQTEAARQADGVHHHYAPLALWEHNGTEWDVAMDGDLRRPFHTLTDITSQISNYHDEHTAHIDQLNTRINELQNEIEQLKEQFKAWSGIVDRTHLIYPYHSFETLQVGHVVALSANDVILNEEEETRYVTFANTHNAAHLMGVVLHAPAVHTDEVAYPVAMYGRAKCFVVGKIRTGDLLIPSNQPGCAKRAGLYLKPGTIIGKALENHEPIESKDPVLINILITLG